MGCQWGVNGESMGVNGGSMMGQCGVNGMSMRDQWGSMESQWGVNGGSMGGQWKSTGVIGWNMRESMESP